MKPVQNKILCSLLAVLCGGLTWTARADITNNFDSGGDFMLTGIIGQTNWDGVYFGVGDIPGGTGTGRTLQSRPNTTMPRFWLCTAPGTAPNGRGTRLLSSPLQTESHPGRSAIF